MRSATINLYSLNYRDYRTYLTSFLFIIGNLILPQLCHLMPSGGIIWLPIYFFTLIGAYKYGWQVGLLTAIFSPVVNSLLFGMPVPAVLPAIMLKSILLALTAGLVASHYRRISIPILAVIVVTYQVVGTIGEWIFMQNLYLSLQDFRLGAPGMLLQVFGGYFVIRHLIRN